ncbi:hypothetical protein A2U01_0061158, partial [Trifolium medium]|nr:hypothetical protein [Trifolium medium]
MIFTFSFSLSCARSLSPSLLNLDLPIRRTTAHRSHYLPLAASQ